MHQRLRNSTCKTWSQVYYDPVDSGLRGTPSPVYREQIRVVRYHPAYWAQRDPFASPCGLGTRHHCIQRYAQPSRVLGTIMHHHPATRARSIHIISITLRPAHRATLCHSRVACNNINSTSPGSQVTKNATIKDTFFWFTTMESISENIWLTKPDMQFHNFVLPIQSHAMTTSSKIITFHKT